MASLDLASVIYLAPGGTHFNACQILLAMSTSTFTPLFLNQAASHDVASIMCQALRGGHFDGGDEGDASGGGGTETPHGRAVQVDSIKTRLESAPGFSA
jgi:hypothetical protein